jgi:tetratricopeptide (TPR) repeat protein
LKTQYTKVVQQADATERLNKVQTAVRLAYEKDGADGALKAVKEVFDSQEAKDNPILRSSLAKAEVQLMTQFEKTKEALARLEELSKDESFSKEDRRTFRERQAELYRQDGKTDDALKAIDALIADAGDDAKIQLGYVMQKAGVLAEADRSDEALAVYDTVLKKAEKGSDEWLAVQFQRAELLKNDKKSKEALEVYSLVLSESDKGSDQWLNAQLNRAELLKTDKKPKEAGVVFDEMLTAESLEPVQKAMLLVYAAEAYHEAKATKETAARVKKAEELVKELSKSEEFPPRFIEQLETRLKDVSGEKTSEEKPAEKKE